MLSLDLLVVDKWQQSPYLPFYSVSKRHEMIFLVKEMKASVTRLGDLLDFGELFKAFGNNLPHS